MNARAGLIALCAGAFCIASSAIRVRLSELGPIGTATFYAGYRLFLSRVRTAVSMASVMAWSSLVCAALLLPVALASGESMFPAALNGWSILIGLALVSHVAGQSLIAFSIAHLAPTLVSLGLLLQPVVAESFAWTVLGEPVVVQQVAGAAIVRVGIWLATRAAARQRRPAERIHHARDQTSA